MASAPIPAFRGLGCGNRVYALVMAGTDDRDDVVRDAEVAQLIAALFFYDCSLSGGKPAATTEKAVVFPVMALWVAGCVVKEGTVAVATEAIVIVVSEFEELRTTEMEPESLSVEAGVSFPPMSVLRPGPRELNPTQPEKVEQEHWTPRTGDESEE